MRKAIVPTAVVFLVMYVAWPYYATYRLFTELPKGDRAQLDTQIDFVSVRASIKDELNAVFMEQMASSDVLDKNPFAGLAMALLPKLIDSTIDAYVTPAGISAMINNPSNFGEVAAKDIGDVKNAGEQGNNKLEFRKIEYAFFQNPTSFLIRIEEGLQLRLQLQDWGWKLTRIYLPTEQFSKQRAAKIGVEPEQSQLEQEATERTTRRDREKTLVTVETEEGELRRHQEAIRLEAQLRAEDEEERRHAEQLRMEDKDRLRRAEQERLKREREVAEKKRHAELARRAKIEAERRAKQQAAAAASAAQHLVDDYKARVSAKVRSRVVMPPNIYGNPEALYEVVLMPGGDVLSVNLKKSSGVPAYDTAVRRAIIAAQPLPVPGGDLFQDHFRRFSMSFRPKE